MPFLKSIEGPGWFIDLEFPTRSMGPLSRCNGLRVFLRGPKVLLVTPEDVCHEIDRSGCHLIWGGVPYDDSRNIDLDFLNEFTSGKLQVSRDRK